MRPIPACPECGGTNTRKFFQHGSSAYGKMSFGMKKGGRFDLAALVCIECGYTELRPHPDDLPAIRKAAEHQ